VSTVNLAARFPSAVARRLTVFNNGASAPSITIM
jgi:hypothetical protein